MTLSTDIGNARFVLARMLLITTNLSFSRQISNCNYIVAIFGNCAFCFTFSVAYLCCMYNIVYDSAKFLLACLCFSFVSVTKKVQFKAC